MQVTREQQTPTTVKLTIAADQALLDEVKHQILRSLGRDMKLPGFRPGKVPPELVEKHADNSRLQSEFLESAADRLYAAALAQEKLRPVAHPKVNVSKFVPFTTLEFDAEVEVIGDVTLADYKKIKLAKKPVEVTEKDVDDVIQNLRTRAAEKKDVARAAKNGDQVIIDFEGKDAKSNEPVKGADGKGYPLVLGSDTFIPGFEANLIGLKAGGQKTFTITFPKDYGVKALQNRAVTFTVTVTKVQEVLEPKADDAFAAQAGPFKSLKDLRSDIKAQLTSEKQTQANRDYVEELLEKIAAKSTVAIPAVLIDEEVERIERQTRQNLAYRGQTWQEYLENLGQTEEDHHKGLREPAELRVKKGLVLTEVADQEDIAITPHELDLQIKRLKGQYKDKAMQAELDKPEVRRQILSDMLTEKTVAKLTEYATAS